MTLTEEEVKKLKDQLRQQIQHLDPDKKAEAEKQIDSMSSEALEEMLKQQQSSSNNQNKNIFRMIVDGEVETVKLGDNQEAIAILDITPISKGHTLIIPKNPVKTPEEIPRTAFSLAEEISKKIISNLKAKSTKAETTTQFGEAVIHLIPIYNEDLNKDSPRSKSNLDELKALKKIIETLKIEKTKPAVIKKKTKTEKDPPLKIKKRIP